MIELARRGNTSSARSGNVVIIANQYDEECTLPCGVAVDNSERPLFFFIRDGSPISGDECVNEDLGEQPVPVVIQAETGLHTTGAVVWA
ncbi:MAG: hypothetical protein K0V04_30990 [Deltaproteobacteria bacterium]|nr:hypothetical protein [Deltaproteobacteria bacterium]